MFDGSYKLAKWKTSEYLAPRLVSMSEHVILQALCLNIYKIIFDCCILLHIWVENLLNSIR